MKKNKAFTLLELLISAGLLALTFAGILTFFFQYLSSIEATRNLSIAMNAAQEQMEKIKARVDPLDESKRITFDKLITYNKRPFDILDAQGKPLSNFKGVSYVTLINFSDCTDCQMLNIKTVVCWKNANGRMFGEDANLNGQFDGGEDTLIMGQTGEIDSIAFIRADLANME